MEHQSKFEVGDILICIKAGNLDNQIGRIPPLKLYGEYPLVRKQNCPGCKTEMLDVGLFSSGKRHMCQCGSNFPTNETHWCSPKRFIKKDEIGTTNVEALLEEMSGFVEA